MARYSVEDKSKIVGNFNRVRSAFTESASWGTDGQLDILVNSINQNTGTNFQSACCTMILTGPTPTHPMFIQCLGRIVRIGQKYKCLIIELFDPNTHNNGQALASTRRAIPWMAAGLNPELIAKMYGLVEENDDPIEIDVSSLEGFVMIDGELINKAHPTFPKEHEHVDEMCKSHLSQTGSLDSFQVDKPGIHPAAPSFLRVLLT